MRQNLLSMIDNCIMDQMDFFSQNSTKQKGMPLAALARPRSLNDFMGHERILGRYSFLTKPGKGLKSLILWGPPGCGKTTLAEILASTHNLPFTSFSAVMEGVAELRKIVKKIPDGSSHILFIDEIHRFNKAQQDALLPHVESGKLILIGATTENPRVSLNKALLSRVVCIPLKSLNSEEVLVILQEAAKKFDLKSEKENLLFLSKVCGGDARKALSLLELYQSYTANDGQTWNDYVLDQCREYDSKATRHFDTISAFIKSMRASEVQSALLYLAIMLEGGEDPAYIARRMIVFASEDIGNADPQALSLALNVYEAVKTIGMPECRINLSQGVTYLALTVKSNAAYKAINKAMSFVTDNPTINIPEHLRNFPAPSAPKYIYPHDLPNGVSRQDYSSINLPAFYQPLDVGREKTIKERLEWLEKFKASLS